MNTDKTKKIVTASMLAALCCILTMVIKIPSPLKGYLNLGDCAVLLSGFTLSPLYGFMAAGLGSALADMISGYVVYAPATFFIKGITALAARLGFKLIRKALGNTASRILSAVISEIVMILGYFVFESCLYGFAPSLINIPANALQGTVGVILGVILTKISDKYLKSLS